MIMMQFIPSTFFLFIASCSMPDTKMADLPLAEPAPVMHSKDCYLAATAKDTVRLSINKDANVATGELTYMLAGKDKNTGIIDGTFKGDTLLLNYTFKSEGVESVRQIVFLNTKEGLREGYADMEERNGKMVFKNVSTADFSGSMILKKVSCN